MSAMKRQLRKRKEVHVSRVPVIMDDIYVFWELDGSRMWWPASVIEVKTYDRPRGLVHGQGRLLYKRYKSYSPEEADVKFLYTPRKGHLIMQRYNGSNLEMSWSSTLPRSTPSKEVKDEPAEIQINAISTDGDEGIEKEPKVQRRDRTSPRSSTSSGSFFQPDSSRRVPTERVTRSLPHIGPSTSAANAQQQEVTGEKDDDDRKRKMHTQSAFDEFLKGSSYYLNSLNSSNFYEQLATLVLHELRIDLVSELHRNFRPTAGAHAARADIDLQQRCIRTSVSCTLSTFSFLARMIRSCSSNQSVHFYPDYNQTQTPSIAAQRFTIFFNGIDELSTALRFNDQRDFATLFWREKTSDSVFYTRVLGSLSASVCSVNTATTSSPSCDQAEQRSTEIKPHHLGNSQSVSTDAVPKTSESPAGTSSAHAASRVLQDEDIIYVGLSMNASIIDNVDQRVNDPSKAARHSIDTNEITQRDSKDEPPVQIPADNTAEAVSIPRLSLVRKKVQWDGSGFLSRWASKEANLKVDPPPEELFYRKDKKLEGVFALRWEAKQVPRTTAWTADALRADEHVLGKLEAVVPWVLLSGDQCMEVGDILSAYNFTRS